MSICWYSRAMQCMVVRDILLVPEVQVMTGLLEVA